MTKGCGSLRWQQMMEKVVDECRNTSCKHITSMKWWWKSDGVLSEVGRKMGEWDYEPLMQLPRKVDHNHCCCHHFGHTARGQIQLSPDDKEGMSCGRADKGGSDHLYPVGQIGLRASHAILVLLIWDRLGWWMIRIFHTDPSPWCLYAMVWASCWLALWRRMCTVSE